MNKKRYLIAGLAVAAGLGMGISANADVDMQRLYNPNSGEHFYTAGSAEKDSLIKAGWKYEGIGWVAPDNGDPVYRLYNPNAGDHFYTLSAYERNELVKVGWNDEGIGWYSGGNTPVYRAYNPNAVSGAHNYTPGSFEQNSLIKAGWKDEGIAWYGISSEPVTSSQMNLAQIQKGDFSSIEGIWKDKYGNTLTITKSDITGYIPEADFTQKVIVKDPKIVDGYLMANPSLEDQSPLIVPKDVKVTGSPYWADDSDSTQDRIIAAVGKGAMAPFNEMSRFAYYKVK
ncbi:MAG: DUF6287 domain-containing protein [Streptococcaceae bacterium]|jgi:hypothetical protein|nr:DUF6287 domain-containing protein [Streptococcaceae bacterium]